MSFKRIMYRFYRMVDRYDGAVLVVYCIIFILLLASSFAFSFDPIAALVWKR